MTQQHEQDRVRTVSVVVPVYRGRETLRPLVDEISTQLSQQVTASGHCYRVSEVVLVWDCGPDSSDEVIRELESEHAWVRAVWLSKNYGQHPATLAGMASSGGDWVVTMDEDGQHDPADIGELLDTAISARAQLVYGVPVNPPPHGALRNAASRATKSLAMRLLADDLPGSFSSYRLVLGEVARSVAAYAGPGVFLDVALGWITGRIAHCPVTSRTEGRPPTSYTFRRLASHFWRLVISSGTRPLRLVSAFGFLVALLGLVLAVLIVILRVADQVVIEGWTSVMVAVLLIGGAILFSLGMIAEYIGAGLRSAMGRPPYVTVRDPHASFADLRLEHGD